MTTHTITVTQDDIDDGQRVHPFDCPIARALSRNLLPGMAVSVAHVIVVFDSIEERDRTYTEREELCRIEIPPVAREFMLAFDYGNSVVPFSFDIEL